GDQGSAQTPEDRNAAANDKGKPGGSAGFGSDKGSAGSTTRSGISGVSGNTEARTGDKEVGVKPIFDKDRVRNEVNAQITITAEFGSRASKAVGDYAAGKLDEASRLRDQAEREKDPVRARELEAQAQTLEDDWGAKGKMRLLAHTIVGGLTGGAGGAAGGAASVISAPEVADALAQAGIDGPLAQVITGVAVTVIGEVVGGHAGGAAAGNEVVNNYLTHAQALDKQRRLGDAKTDKERQQVNDEYNRLDKEQQDNAGACLLRNQCASVFDKDSLKSVLNELNAACAPPRLCTAEEKTSIDQLNQFYAVRDSIKPDSTIEEVLLGNKLISSAINVARGVIARGTAETVYAKPLGVVEDFNGNPIKVLEAAPQYAFRTEANITGTGANLENAATQFVKDEAGKDFIGVISSKIGNTNNGFDLVYAKMIDGKPQLIIGEAKAGDGLLSALGERQVSTLNRNLAEIEKNINQIADEKIRLPLLEQVRQKSYQVELYTATGNAAKTSARVDDVLINRMGQPVRRVVTFEKN
ncbi:hypothetical protein M4Q70_22480, partial [Acidovorax valerianellae]|nr:hypothetical protein [Paracidovorax valerianellae]